MKAPTNADIARWRAVYAEYAPKLQPNQKSAEEVIQFLQAHYTLLEQTSAKARAIVVENVLLNAVHAQRLGEGEKPDPIAFFVLRDARSEALYRHRSRIYRHFPIYIGVDRATCSIFVEGSDCLHDQLTAFRGLDAQESTNFYLVANYVRCKTLYALNGEAIT